MSNDTINKVIKEEWKKQLRCITFDEDDFVAGENIEELDFSGQHRGTQFIAQEGALGDLTLNYIFLLIDNISRPL